MKTKTYYIILSALIFAIVTSCSNSNEHKKIMHDVQIDSLSITKILEDTSKVMVAQLPVYFDSTEVIIMPVGLIDLNDINKQEGYKSRLLPSFNKNSDDVYYSEIGRITSDDHINGNMTNLIFEDLSQNDSQPRILTNKAINITQIQYLRSLAKKSNKHYLFYHVYDSDSNADGKLDYNDVLSVYVSNLDGTEFTKITKDKEEFESGKWIPFASRYYFRTIEDANKDGIFDKTDKYHYYYIDFTQIPYRVVDINPIGMIIP